MKTVVLDGTNYTKVSVLAKRYGYTTDYLGQLCRSGKIQAEMVGRAWYAVEESLQAHKAGRYQTPGTDENTDSDSRDIHINKHHSSIQVEPRLSKTTKRSIEEVSAPRQSSGDTSRIRYSDDQSDLAPTLTKGPHSAGVVSKVHIAQESSLVSRSVPVLDATAPPAPESEAPATSVKVSRQSKPYDLSFTELPAVALRGKVTIKNLENEDYIGQSTEAPATKPPRMVKPKFPHQVRIPVTDPARPETAKSSKTDSIPSHKTAASKPTATAHVPATTATKFAPASVQTPPSRPPFGVIAAGLVFALLIGAAVLAAETTYFVDGESVTATWSLQPASLLDAWTSVRPW